MPLLTFVLWLFIVWSLGWLALPLASRVWRSSPKSEVQSSKTEDRRPKPQDRRPKSTAAFAGCWHRRRAHAPARAVDTDGILAGLSRRGGALQRAADLSHRAVSDVALARRTRRHENSRRAAEARHHRGGSDFFRDLRVLLHAARLLAEH